MAGSTKAVSAVEIKERPILMNATGVRGILKGRKTQTRRIVRADELVASDLRGPYATNPRVSDGGYLSFDWMGGKYNTCIKCPYGQPGDRLWVKESWAYRLDMDHLNGTQLYDAGVRQAWYWADGPGKTCNTGCAGAAGRVRAARFMPRWASRLTLEITDIRVERAQDISEEDAKAEGCESDAGKYETWWQGYDSRITSRDGDFPHTQVPRCEEPPDWLIEPRRMNVEVGLGLTAKQKFHPLWDATNGKGAWEFNSWVWVVEFRRIP